MPQWLMISIGLSVVGTVLLNVLPRLFPGATRRMEQRTAERFDELQRQSESAGSQGGGSRVKVYFPWKWMLGLSIGGTLLLNLIVRL